jgi:hypothetical protein
MQLLIKPHDAHCRGFQSVDGMGWSKAEAMVRCNGGRELMWNVAVGHLLETR